MQTVQKTTEIPQVLQFVVDVAVIMQRMFMGEEVPQTQFHDRVYGGGNGEGCFLAMKCCVFRTSSGWVLSLRGLFWSPRSSRARVANKLDDLWTYTSRLSARVRNNSNNPMLGFRDGALLTARSLHATPGS